MGRKILIWLRAALLPMILLLAFVASLPVSTEEGTIAEDENNQWVNAIPAVGTITELDPAESFRVVIRWPAEMMTENTNSNVTFGFAELSHDVRVARIWTTVNYILFGLLLPLCPMIYGVLHWNKKEKRCRKLVYFSGAWILLAAALFLFLLY